MDGGNGQRHILKKTKVERDLGIYISDDLKWKCKPQMAAAKANSMLGQLKRSINYSILPTFVLISSMPVPSAVHT